MWIKTKKINIEYCTRTHMTIWNRTLLVYVEYRFWFFICELNAAFVDIAFWVTPILQRAVDFAVSLFQLYLSYSKIVADVMATKQNALVRCIRAPVAYSSKCTNIQSPFGSIDTLLSFNVCSLCTNKSSSLSLSHSFSFQHQQFYE